MIHMQINDNNFDVNNIYLQRRQLNIQDEEHVNYNSDDQEQKQQEEMDNEIPEEVKNERAANEEEKRPAIGAPGAGLLKPINTSKLKEEEEKKQGGGGQLNNQERQKPQDQRKPADAKAEEGKEKKADNINPYSALHKHNLP